MLILLRITGMAWRYRMRLCLALLSTLGTIGFVLLRPHILGETVDKLVRFEDGKIVPGDVELSTLVWLAVALLSVSLIRGLFNFGRTYTSDSLSQKVAYDLRNDIYDKLQHLSFAYHDKEHTGDLMSKATADVEAIRRFIMMGLVRSFETLLSLLAIIPIMVILNWQLTLISLAFVPFLVIRSTVVVGRMRKLWLHVQEVTGQLVTLLQENLSGIHVVKAFAGEEHESKKYARKAEELQQEHFKSERLQGTNSAWMTFYFTLALGLIMWFGGLEVIRGDLTAGGLAKFLLYMGVLTFPIRTIAFTINAYSRAISSSERLFDVMDARSPVEEKDDAVEMSRAQGYVRFNNVSFSYDHQAPALARVNISVEPGSVVALLGAPGSGKTTVGSLIPRFYDATDGQITIDGEDIRDFTLASLRRNVGVVQQDVFLFAATIKENIAYGAMGASLEEIVQAAKIAQLHDHIESLPEGYDTWVGERGVTLSGGQRQRLSIARTILVNPPVLILDDSTSSVDVETERLIHRAMAQVVKGRTTFVIAHRLSSVRDADLILVLRDGQIVEEGTHEELIAQGGIYQDIYDLQLRPQEELMLDPSLQPGSVTGSNPGRQSLHSEPLAADDGGDT